MWKIIIPFLITLGIIKASNDCSLHSYLLCGVDDVPEYFPGTQEELYSACKIELRFLRCVIRTEEKCETNPAFIQQHYDFLSAVKEMCNKESLSHTTIVDSLECVKPLFDENSNECFKSYPGSRGMKKYVKALRREGIPAFTKDKDDKKECVQGLYVLACETMKMERICGTTTAEAFIKIIYTRTRAVTERCNDKIKRHLLSIVRVFKSEQEEEEQDMFLIE